MIQILYGYNTTVKNPPWRHFDLSWVLFRICPGCSVFFVVKTTPFQKICYDKAGNLPNKGGNLNTQTWGKIVYFLFVWLVGIGFRQNFFRLLPNFGDFGAEMSFLHYIIYQNRNNFIKHCSPPPCTKKPLISEMCIYIKSSLCKWGLGTRGGGTMFYRQKTKGVSA